MVNHKILQEKLEHHGIGGIALDWCRDYLTNRKKILKTQIRQLRQFNN